MAPLPDLSIVIPIHNEAPNLGELVREFTSVLTSAGRSYEILLIDDGSTDGSFEILRELQAADPRLRVIQFRRNFGQTAAFAAGFAHAPGRHIVTPMQSARLNTPAAPRTQAITAPCLSRERSRNSTSGYAM